MSRWWRRRRSDRGGPSGQRADARGCRARARRGRVPVLGLRAFQDPASLRRNVERGRSRSSPRRLTRGMDRRLSQGLQTRAVDGTRPRRQPACRRDGGDRGQALSRRRETDGPAHCRGWRRAAHRAPRRGDRQRQHRGDPTHPWPGHRRVLDQPPGGDSEGAAGLAGDPRRRAPLASSWGRPSHASAPR